MTNTLPLESVAIPVPCWTLLRYAPEIRVAHKTPPTDEYLAMKQSKTSTYPVIGSDALLTPLELNNVSAAPYDPATNTLPLESVAIPYPVSVAVPPICAAHKTPPADEYLAMKQSFVLPVSALARAALLTPLELYKVSVLCA